MSAYQLADWANFAVASAGAAAALTGLLFVAVSINLKRILEFPHLPDRAAGTLGLLLTILLVAVVLLAPGQPRQATGVEIAALSALLACGAVMIALRTYAHVHDPLSWVHLVDASVAGARVGLDDRRHLDCDRGRWRVVLGARWCSGRIRRRFARTHGFCSSKFSGDGRETIGPSGGVRIHVLGRSRSVRGPDTRR